jgi:hypothetical protein
MHHVTDVEAMREPARVDHDQPAVTVDVDSAPVDPLTGHLDLDPPAKGGHNPAIPVTGVVGQCVERREERDEHVDWSRLAA